jgi:hypothetical protein
VVHIQSVDRVDSAKGYIDSNVVSCTIDINSKKIIYKLRNRIIILKIKRLESLDWIRYTEMEGKYFTPVKILTGVNITFIYQYMRIVSLINFGYQYHLVKKRERLIF